MSLKDNFCPSPWVHMRINNAGHYEYCRWAVKDQRHQNPHISTTSPKEFFQHSMSPIRRQLLDGQSPSGCAECLHVDQHRKVSGRQRQLLKIGVRLDQFEKTMASSPWLPEFSNGEHTSQLPQDWQIDLGNYCNGACVFCSPHSSSRLATEFKKIGIVHQTPSPNWTDSPELVQKLIDTLVASPHIQYLHFIGGETLITPAFKIMLEALIQAGLNRTATIGFTTNLGIWRDDVVELLKQFQGVNLGMSVESFKIVNDYVRYPVCLPTMFETMDRWIELAKQQDWLLQFRTTPTALTVGHMLGIYDYAWHHGIAVESCNFLNKPECLRPSVLPLEYRQRIINDLQIWLDKHLVNSDVIVNTRDPNIAQQQIAQDLQSYVKYLKAEPDESWRLPDLVKYLKQLESSRGNSIVTYLPEYEELFRTAGY
jgi:sulfatase maturation enzyme AslB (radical SAM superfamily)